MYRDPKITSQSAQFLLGPSAPPGTASSPQAEAEAESARIRGQFTNIGVGDSVSQYYTH